MRESSGVRGKKHASRCLVCGGKVNISVKGLFDARFGAEGRYNVGECASCGLLQLAPLPSQGALKKLYQRYYNFGGSGKGAYTGARRLFFDSVLSRLWSFIDGDISFYDRKGSGRLLDVGCNEGRGLARYEKNGFQAEGLELNEKAASTASAAGFTVHTALLGEFRPAEPFDVVVLSNVLEHVLDPIELLEDASRVLKPGGELWISCPNAASWQRAFFSKAWINWHVPFHTAHFSGKNIRKLLDAAGFEVKKIKNESPALWFASSVVSKLFSRHGKPTTQMRNAMLMASLMLFTRGVLFPALWLGNLLGKGDCLVITARKK